MQRFRRMRSLQKFASVHASIINDFNQERSPSSGQDSNLSRAAAPTEWRVFTAKKGRPSYPRRDGFELVWKHLACAEIATGHMLPSGRGPNPSQANRLGAIAYSLQRILLHILLYILMHKSAPSSCMMLMIRNFFLHLEDSRIPPPPPAPPVSLTFACSARNSRVISVAYRSSRIVETPRARVFPSILVGRLKCRRDPVRFVPSFPASRESTGNFDPFERMEPRSDPNTFGFSRRCVRFPCAQEQGIFLKLSGMACLRTRKGLARSVTHPSASRQTLDDVSKQVLLRMPAKW